MYEKSTFAKGTAASLGVVALVGVLVMASGTAYAMPVAGVGGFTIKAKKVTSQQVVIYPGVDDTSERSAYPMAVVEQKGVEIEGLRMIKELDVSPMPGLSGNARLVISSSGTVTADQQVLKFSRLDAEKATFNGQIVDERASDDPSRKFEISSGSYDGRTVDISDDGPAQVLRNATINAHYLASNQISMPGMQFSVQYDQDGDGTYETRVGSTASGNESEA
ncbi:MAG: DUF6230 family protein [Haloarculaceae archaeon]